MGSGPEMEKDKTQTSGQEERARAREREREREVMLPFFERGVGNGRKSERERDKTG